MANDEVLERIASWQAAGLIDGETAARLRAAEAEERGATVDTPGHRPVSFGSFFGPTPSIAELFGYLGAGFVLAAWHTLNVTTGSGRNLVEWLLPAIAFGVIGIVLAGRSEREQRAAGVAFGVATAHVFISVAQVFPPVGTDSNVTNTISAAAAVASALAFRRFYPAVLTQLGLLGALAAFAAASLAWLGSVLFPSGYGPDVPYPPAPDPNALVRVLLNMAWWLAWAIGFGVIGLWEARRGEQAGPAGAITDHGAARRASVVRFVAGLTAVGGAMLAVTTGHVDELGQYGRTLVPWLGDGIVLGIALVLLGLAVRRGATAYLYPAALGVIVAFSDLNVQYVAEQTGIGLALLVEGLILIGVGLLAERLRRRLAAVPAGMPTDLPAAPFARSA